jgi:hypothetical protein
MATWFGHPFRSGFGYALAIPPCTRLWSRFHFSSGVSGFIRLNIIERQRADENQAQADFLIQR